MKRRVSDSDTHEPSSRGACSAKRRKMQCGDIGAAPVSSHLPVSPPPKSPLLPRPPPPPNPPSQTPGEETFLTQQTTSDAPKSSIQNWIEGSTFLCNSEMMAAPPPRSAYGSDRGRLARRYERSHRSRTPSPSKKPSPQTYRTRNMYNVGVYVDRLFDLPPATGDEVRHILGFESLGDRVVAIVDEPQSLARLTQLAATFCTESRRNARDCLLEGDWKASLNSLVKNLADLSPEVLRTHMSEKSKSARYARELMCKMLTVCASVES